MELLIENRAYALRKIERISSLMVTLVILLIIWDVNFTVPFIFILSGIYLLIFIFLIRMWRKSNIRKAYLKDAKFLLLFRKKIIEVPFTEIINITSATNDYFTFKGLNAILNTLYIIDLKNSYPFGDTLMFKFDFNPDNDPEEIKKIKRTILN